MPFYEYICSACGLSSEFLQRVSDPPERTCPHCGAETLTKQISAAGFRLKGGGWYETDFKSEKKRNLATAPTDSGGPRNDDAAAPAKSDSANAPVAETKSKAKQKEKPVGNSGASSKKDASAGTTSSA